MKKIFSLYSVFILFFIHQVVAQTITVVSPNGGESLSAGSPYNISWSFTPTTTAQDIFTIDLLVNNTFYLQIATNISSNTFAWNIPTNLADRNDYRVRVSRIGNTANNDISDAPFSIRGGRSITIAALTNSVFVRGATVPINWTYLFNFINPLLPANDNVRIDLFLNGSLAQNIVPFIAANTGTSSWIVPAMQAIGNNYQIRITSLTDANIVANSSIFAIEQTLALTAPNGGEAFAKGSMQTIRWASSVNVVDNLRIELISAGGNVVQTISAGTPAGAGNISWTIPTTTPDGAGYKIRITSATNANLIDESDAGFAIGQFLVVTAPANGAIVSKETNFTIRWNTNFLSLLRIDLLAPNGSIINLAINIPSNTQSSFDWIPRADIPTGDNYRIRISSTVDVFSNGTSDPFTIIAPPTLTLTAPVGGEVWQKNKSYNITWQSGVQGNLRIDLFRNGTLFQNITPSVAVASNSFPWTISSSVPAGNTYRVNITSLSVANLTGQSPANFTIGEADSIRVTNPIANANLIRNTTVNITWTSNIGSRNVTIELMSGGNVVTTIVSNTANTGSFPWAIPQRIENDQPLPTGNYRIRVRTTSGVNVESISPLFALIEPTFSVASPNGGEQFFRGFTYPISWNTNLNDAVKIDLFSNNLVFIRTIEANATGGTFNWTVPLDLPESNFYSIRITSVVNPNVTSSGQGNFRVIQGQIQVTSPRGGEVWYSSGFRYNTQWTNNTQRPVRVDLVRAGVVITTLNTSTLATSLDISLPDGIAEGTDYRIRVSSLENATLFAESNQFRVIRPFITVTAPRGGEQLIQDLNHTVSWQSNLPADELVQIDLYIGTIFNRSINPSLPNNGTATFPVTTAIPFGNNYTIRVSVVRVPTIFGQSAAPFSVIRDNIPPVISDELTPALLDASDGSINALTTSITATDNVGLASVVCFFKNISTGSGTTSWGSRIQATQDFTGKWLASIPKTVFGNDIGIEYYWEATDRAGNVTRSPREGQQNPRLAHLRYANQNIPNIIFGDNVGSYQIIAIPLELNDKTIKGVFEKTLGEYDDQKWRLLRYEDGKLLEYKQENGITEIELGKGYWLIVRDKPLDNFTTGEGTTARVSSLRPFSTNLSPGWNQIGNPYNYNLSWRDVVAGNTSFGGSLGNLKTYEQENFKNTDVLLRYRGGFVFASQAGTLRFPTLKNLSINSGGRVENEEITNPISDPVWEVRLQATSGRISNEFAGFGMNPSAEVLKDNFDDMTLPRFGKYLEVNFNRPAYFYPKFTKDIVPTQENFIWEFTVEANTSENQTKLSWENAYFGNTKKLILLDQELQRFVDMSAVKEYNFTKTVDKYRFKIIFGNEQFLMENLQADKVIFNNQPNPFSSETQFNFTLPLDFADSHVSIKVYNAMGQEVTSLANRNYPAGFQEIKWDGKDSNGNTLPKGLYISRLQIENLAKGLQSVISRKIILE